MNTVDQILKELKKHDEKRVGMVKNLTAAIQKTMFACTHCKKVSILSSFVLDRISVVETFEFGEIQSWETLCDEYSSLQCTKCLGCQSILNHPQKERLLSLLNSKDVDSEAIFKMVRTERYYCHTAHSYRQKMEENS